MKIAGREVKGKNRKTVVLPREGQDPIVFVAEAISDFGRLNDFLPVPEPPVVTKPGGVVEKNFKDKGYQQQMINYNTRRMAWVFLQSIKPSNIEWATVDENDPSTWTNYLKELQEAGFSAIEIGRIGDAVLEANCLDEDKLEAARQVFLRGQAAARKDSSGQNTPAQSSQSGEPVSDSK